MRYTHFNRSDELIGYLKPERTQLHTQIVFRKQIFP